MQIPFYYSFKEFEENYILDKPKQIDFLEYLRLLKTKYQNELNRANGYVKNCLERLQDPNFSDLSERYDILYREVSNLLSEIDLVTLNSEFYLNYTVTDINGNELPLINRFSNSPRLFENEELFYKFIKIKNEKDNYYTNVLSKPIKVAEQILILINREIEREKINIFRFQTPQHQTFETPENDFSNNEDKEKLIILEKLKIIDYIKSIQTKPETISHTAEILSAITGINSTTLYTYLRPMLNANRDDADKNSPYKNSDNVLNANKTIQKLKIKNTDANN